MDGSEHEGSVAVGVGDVGTDSTREQQPKTATQTVLGGVVEGGTTRATERHGTDESAHSRKPGVVAPRYYTPGQTSP